ncbi:MAG: slipin family protein [Chloroflexi bacterium]|nr:slipin family protein [Chloroflexota bacterium]
MFEGIGTIAACLAIAGLLGGGSIITSAIRIVQEYERLVVFRLGRVIGVKGPGVVLLIPFVDRAQKVDLRVVTLDVPTQEAITYDNVTVKVNAVVYFRVLEPRDAVVEVEDYRRATWQVAQTSLRSVIGEAELDELLAERDRINDKLAQIVDEATEPWGIKVSIVEIKDVELPLTMQRAMARQAEAEREKRAKIIHAEGEFQASKQLAEAAGTIASEPIAMQLRYLQVLNEVAAENNETFIFPVPMEVINSFTKMARAIAQENENNK